MRKINAIIILSAIICSHQVMADDTMMTSVTDDSASNPCTIIVKSCLAAGYSRTEVAGKQFWHDCMKPILLGQTVATVTVDPMMVQSCRAHKIEELKSELQDFQKVMPTTMTMPASSPSTLQ